MITQTIFPRVNTYIPPISRSFRFNGGIATVILDSLGNYEILVNDKRSSPYENSAKREANYKVAVSEISLKMMTAFEKRDADFTAMHKKAQKIHKFSEFQKKIETLAPQRYEREKFPLSRPMRDDVRRDLEAEADARFVDLFYDRVKEKNDFINFYEREALASRLRAYEEVQAFFNCLQNGKEAKANAAYQREHEQQKKGIEDFIKGDITMTERNLRAIIGELALPFRIELSCDYNEKSGLLNTEIELYGDMSLPKNKTNILSTGKISVKDKLLREMEQFKTETIASMVFYVAASLFNATINIRTQRITVWLDGKREGLIWIQFDREKFAKLSMRTLSPLLNYYDWPRVDILRMVRGATQFCSMDSVSFKKAIAQAERENPIAVAEQRVIADASDPEVATVSIGYARTVGDTLPNDPVIRSLVDAAIQSGARKVVIPVKYRGILNELRKS